MAKYAFTFPFHRRQYGMEVIELNLLLVPSGFLEDDGEVDSLHAALLGKECILVKRTLVIK